METEHKRKAEILLDAALLFLLTAVLIAPLFKAGYLDQWGSIESTFIADARFLIEHWPHPQWQPLWYTGTRFDYIYPPALRYGTALTAMFFRFPPVKAYHAYTAFFYCLGVAGVYLLTRVAAGSRGMAWLAGAMTALLSPSFLILRSYRADSFRLAPHRLGVLVRWGEGPHISALALIPFALVFAWLALENQRGRDVSLAALFSAAVLSTNFYGAAALAVFYPILVWSFWITRRDRRIAAAAAAIPVLAYGLTAFWLVPSYFSITGANMKYVAAPPNSWALPVAVSGAVVFAILSHRFAGGRPDRTWAVFTAGCAVFFSLSVLTNHFFQFRFAGEPHRWVPELDLVYILGSITILRWMWNQWRGRVLSVAAAALVIAAFYSAQGYLLHAWEIFRASPDYQARVEYQIPEWLWRNRPGTRTQAAGSVRFWFDAWRDLAQLGGGSDQGQINGLTQDAQWEINLASRPETSILWMQSMGVDTAYVSGPDSQEIYKDTRNPEKFSGVLPLLYDDHHGNQIYQVPRRYQPRARVVDSRALAASRALRDIQDAASLRAYVAVIENGPEARPESIRESTDAILVRARLAAGQSIVVQESYDPAWQATSGGQSLQVHRDPMGFLVVEAPPGDREIRLRFVTPLENRVGRGVTILTMLLLILLGARSLGRR